MDIFLCDIGGDGLVVLFLYGLLVDGLLWDVVVECFLGYCCFVFELLLGLYMMLFVDCSWLMMEGVVDFVVDVFDEFDVCDVMVVGNDIGGVFVQLLVMCWFECVGWFVLMLCDVFEVFLLLLFKLLFVVGCSVVGLNLVIQLLRFGLGCWLLIVYGKLFKCVGDE